MIPEFLTETTNANILVLSLSENMNAYRNKSTDIPILRSLPKRLASLNMLIIGQVACILFLPRIWRHRGVPDEIVNMFRDVDICQYEDEAVNELCKILEGACIFMDEIIHETEELQLHRAWALRWLHKKRISAKEELEDILEVWLLARNPEFREFLDSVLDEFGQYIKTMAVSMETSE